MKKSLMLFATAIFAISSVVAVAQTDKKLTEKKTEPKQEVKAKKTEPNPEVSSKKIAKAKVKKEETHEKKHKEDKK